MLVREYKQMDDDVQFTMLLPEKCPECGGDMVMSDVLTHLHCSNERCITRIVKRLTAMLSQMGVKGMGKESAKKFFQFYGIVNPLAILSYEPQDGDYGVGLTTAHSIYEQINEHRKMTLWEYVRYANLPNIQSSALQIFGGYDDLDSAYKDIEAGGMNFIKEKIGVDKNDTISLRALKIYQTLKEYKNELMECLGFVEIIPVNKVNVEVMQVVCSDEVGGRFKTKNEFYAYVNNNQPEGVHVNFLPSLTKKTHVLIWNGADVKGFEALVESGEGYIDLPDGRQARVTSKVKKALNYNKKLPDDSKIVIASAEGFIKAMGI